MAKKNGFKISQSFVSGDTEISKYKKIVSIQLIPAQPGEEYYEVTYSDGKKVQISPDEKRRLDKLIKK